MASVGYLTNSVIDSIVKELQKDENKKKLQCNILDPVATYLERSLKPYFFALLIILLVMIGLLVLVLKNTIGIKSVTRLSECVT